MVQCSGVRTWHFHCSGMDSIPGLGTSTCSSEKKKKMSHENSNLNTTTKNKLAVLGTCQHHLSGLGINLSFKNEQLSGNYRAPRDLHTSQIFCYSFFSIVMHLNLVHPLESLGKAFKIPNSIRTSDQVSRNLLR